MKFWKSLILGAVAVGAWALAATSYATSPITDGYIQSSKHDFLNGSYASGSQICLPCHVPHGAALNTGAPTNSFMWNHMTDQTRVYTLYTPSPTYGLTAGLDTNSRLCLSCHDGFYGVDNYGGMYGVSTNALKITGAAQIARGGSDLSKEHPIGAPYPGLDPTSGTWTAPADGTWANPTTVSNAGLRLSKRGTDAKSTIVGCSTCHNPHGAGNPNLLNINNTGSALCLTCHIK